MEREILKFTRYHTWNEHAEGIGRGRGRGLAVGHGAAWALTRQALTLHILLHAGLLHAEGDLGVLVAEQDVCNTRRWISGGV